MEKNFWPSKRAWIFLFIDNFQVERTSHSQTDHHGEKGFTGIMRNCFESQIWYDSQTTIQPQTITAGPVISSYMRKEIKPTIKQTSCVLSHRRREYNTALDSIVLTKPYKKREVIPVMTLIMEKDTPKFWRRFAKLNRYVHHFSKLVLTCSSPNSRLEAREDEIGWYEPEE